MAVKEARRPAIFSYWKGKTLSLSKYMLDGSLQS